MAESLINKAKDSLINKITELKEDFFSDEDKNLFQDLKSSGASKVKEILAGINESSALIIRSGYELTGASVTLGLPPDINLSFAFRNEIEQEEKEKLLNELEANKIIGLIVKSLFKAGSFYESIKMGDYKLTSVEIKLGITPGISIGFTK
jgi:hypothetical protein